MDVLITSSEELQVLVKQAVAEAMASYQQPQPEPTIRGIHQLAKFLGISAVTAQKLKNEGKIPYYQSGRILLFDPSKVRDALGI